MNGCDLDSTSEGSKEAERAKKIYRYVNDTARRIDEATPACKTTSDLFTTYMEGLRQKIRDNCEKLIFIEPLAYGRKALELLWRKAYYETVSIAKKLRIKEDGDDNVFTHIVCGIGHYHHITARIIKEMDVNISILDYPPLEYDYDEADSQVKVDDDVRQWGAGTIHSCLIYLGDLSRYQSEMFDYDPSIAARYYLQAASLDLSSGMPYNQLGNLYTDRNHNLDSVCYYIHCLSCSVPFEGAEGNLARLFEKNAQYLETVNEANVQDYEPADRVKIVIYRFLTLAEVWFTAKENVNVDEICGQTAQDLKLCFAYEEPILPDSVKQFKEFTEIKEAEIVYPSYLNPDIIFKIVQICLFCIHKLNESDPSRAFAVKAFTLALFSQLMQKCLDQIHKFGLQNRSKRRSSITKHRLEEITVKNEKETDTKLNIEKGEITENQSNGHVTEHTEDMVNGVSKSNGKKMSSKRRRRRRLNNDSSEESEESDYSTEGELSSDDDSSSDSDNSYYSDDTNELSDDDNKNEEKFKLTPVKENIEIPFKKTPANDNTIGLNEQKIQNFLRGSNYLPSLKLLVDWILTEPDLIRSCGDSGDAMFQSIVDLINILQANFTNNTAPKNKIDSCNILQFARNASTKLELDFKVIPLPEDVNLRGTDICKFDKDAAEWELLNKFNPTPYEENIIRILNVILFGHQIVKIIPRIRYNRSMQVFFLKKQQQKNMTKVIRKELKKKPQKSSRHADTVLMRSLGRLFLQSQVRELETAVRGGGESPPVYVVVDTDALTGHIRLVKQLVKARKFVVLVPTVVLQSIDELKKEVGGARDAIRWLEAQLQAGSRFLRTQRPNETKPLALLKYPRKPPKPVSQFIQIIEFCHHFVADDAEMGDGDKDKIQEKKVHSMLILLTGTKLVDSDKQKDFSYTGVAQSAGVTVDNVTHFFSKWRHLLSKPGNKR